MATAACLADDLAAVVAAAGRGAALAVAGRAAVLSARVAIAACLDAGAAVAAAGIAAAVAAFLFAIQVSLVCFRNFCLRASGKERLLPCTCRCGGLVQEKSMHSSLRIFQKPVWPRHL